MIFRRIRPEEIRRVHEVWAQCFGYRMKRSDRSAAALAAELRSDPQSRQEACWENTWAAFGDDDATMVSALAVISWEAGFDGHVVRMDGAAAAATLPEYRRRGGISGCFRAAIRDMYASGAALSYLYPFSSAFYERFGYGCGCDRTAWRIDPAAIPDRPVGGTYRMIGPGFDGIPKMRAVDRVRVQRYNLMIMPGDMEYRWAKQANPCAQREYSYVWTDAEGTPRSYVSWAPADGTLDVRRLGFANAEGFMAVLSLLRRAASNGDAVTIDLPTDVSLKDVLTEWAPGRVERRCEARGMVRAIDAQRLLRLAATRGPVALAVRITDDIIPENDGTFRVEADPAGERRVTRTDAAPDVSMDIRAFSRLICGLEDGVCPAWQRGVELFCPPERAARLFFRKPCFIEQFF